MAESSQMVDVSTREFGPSLCDYCNNMFSALEPKYVLEPWKEKSWRKSSELINSDYHPTLSSWYEAVLSGCQLCIMLEHQIHQHGYLDTESHTNPNLDTNFEKVHWIKPALEVRIDPAWHFMTRKSPGRPFHLIEIHLRGGSRTLAIIKGAPERHLAYPGTSSREKVSKELESMRAYCDLNYTPPNSTGDLPALKLCRSWIQNCTENHDKCKGLHPGPGSPWWPTRLLYVGDLSDSHLGVEDLNSLNIQLHITQDKQPKGSYMTLSHCWGVSGEMLKLMMDTYEHRKKKGFSFAELPKTFQDVVRLSRFLGNDYIWIDLLCIIQID